MLNLQPITRREANEFVRQHHRHHRPDQGFKFAVAVNDGEKVVGVAVVGRPRSQRHRDHAYTLEVTRLCTDGTSNAVSKLMRGVRQAAVGMGYRRLITYTLPAEGGASMRGSGMREVGLRGGQSWSAPERGRPRVDTPLLGQKVLWEALL
jgi:hypothetical protein